MKLQSAALGFRVKSGWAVAVLLTGPARLPQLCDVQRIDLFDPRLPETRQRRTRLEVRRGWRAVRIEGGLSARPNFDAIRRLADPRQVGRAFVA